MKAKYTLADVTGEPQHPVLRPMDRVQKRRHAEVEEGEQPLHLSMQAGGSSSVRTVGVCALNECANKIFYLECSSLYRTRSST